MSKAELLNELLSVVKNKLIVGDADSKPLKKDENKTDRNRSITLMTIPQKKHQKSNNQTVASKLASTRKNGIFYPTSTKNALTTPTMMNNSATFISDKDIKVITQLCFVFLFLASFFNEHLYLTNARLAFLMHGAAKCRHETIGCLLSPNSWHHLLVFESLLWARDCRWRMDGKWLTCVSALCVGIFFIRFSFIQKDWNKS